MGRLDHPDHDVAERRGDCALHGAQSRQSFRYPLWRLVELHDQILDHRRFYTGVVALYPPVEKVDDDKYASLKREILAEIPNFLL